MKYVIGAIEWKFPLAPLPFKPALDLNITRNEFIGYFAGIYNQRDGVDLVNCTFLSLSNLPFSFFLSAAGGLVRSDSYPGVYKTFSRPDFYGFIVVHIGVRGGGRQPSLEKFQGKLCSQGNRKLLKNCIEQIYTRFQTSFGLK